MGERRRRDVKESKEGERERNDFVFIVQFKMLIIINSLLYCYIANHYNWPFGHECTLHRNILRNILFSDLILGLVSNHYTPSHFLRG